ncbi:MAG: NYN domain-containing protein [Deltaproteobacteria bacterium]|nr:NYN domain-containing protein [Deltaproteobacteria bacterium]
MVPAPLPKPGSQAARALWDRLRAALDLPRTIVVLEGALDRKTLDDQLQKATRGALGRISSLSRAEVVGRLSDQFHGNEDTATALMKDLDKSCHKERHIVGSIDESALTERLQSYRALDFRRERARLVWALLRDGREAHFAAATRILDEAFKALADKQDVDDAVASAQPAAPEVVAVIEQRMSTYEAAIQQQQQELRQEVVQKESVERERAELVMRLGSREKALREEEGLRRETLAELARAKDTIATLSAELKEARPADHRAVVDAAHEENTRLRERLRSLERAADRAGRVAELEEALETLRSESQQALAQQQKRADDVDEQLRLLQARERGALHRVEELRDLLREARQQLARGPEPAAPPSKRVGVFVDDANLSASARRDLGNRVDYRSLLEALIDGRPKGCAVCFVVDNPDSPTGKHSAFVHSLRDQGWDVREKRVKVRGDGSRKADWDMGMAMEILDVINDVDVVVLGSGDGDFVPLVKRLQRLHKRVEVAAFRASTDEALIAAADAFLGLDGRFRL